VHRHLGRVFLPRRDQAFQSLADGLGQLSVAMRREPVETQGLGGLINSILIHVDLGAGVG
jgi:hypothetical protein